MFSFVNRVILLCGSEAGPPGIYLRLRPAYSLYPLVNFCARVSAASRKNFGETQRAIGSSGILNPKSTDPYGNSLFRFFKFEIFYKAWTKHKRTGGFL